jgi:hypothetical protein
MNLQENIQRIKQIMESNTTGQIFDFTTEGMKTETHQYSVTEVKDSKEFERDKVDPKIKKEFPAKKITLTCISPENMKGNTIDVSKRCGVNIDNKAPRGYGQLPADFITYANTLC